MKPIFAFIITITSLATQAGCSENKAVTAAKAMADAVCACKDAACAQKAMIDGNAKLMEHAKSARGTEDDAKIIAEAERATKCLEKAGTP